MAQMKAKQKVILIGGGGHARVLWDTLSEDFTCEVLGYVDNSGATAIDLKYLGKDDDLLEKFPAGELLLVNGIGSVDLPENREQVFGLFKSKGYRFRSVVHPRAVISSRARLGEGVQVSAGAVINTGAHLGNNVIINTSASIDHDTLVGDHTHVAPGVTVSGGVVIGAGVHVGTGAKVVQGVRIGDRVLVAAGSVVTADVPAHSRVQGVPAKAYEEKN
jgi:UDP-perosamine 4-acetyltransferase